MEPLSSCASRPRRPPEPGPGNLRALLPVLPRQADRRRPGSTAVAHHAARPKPGPGGRRPPHRRPALLLGAAGLLGLVVRTLNRRRGGNPDR